MKVLSAGFGPRSSGSSAAASSRYPLKKRGFTLIELMIVVAILAILAVIAIPAFAKYMRQAKTAEAVEGVERIYKGGAVYFMTPHASEVPGADGALLDCQFPTTVALTPAASCCDAAADADGDGRCDAADATVWNDAEGVWPALAFEQADAHYFVYGFSSGGTGTSAFMVATARGDLDCDGVMSTFSRTGGTSGTATVSGECRLKGGAALVKVNETE